MYEHDKFARIKRKLVVGTQQQPSWNVQCCRVGGWKRVLPFLCISIESNRAENQQQQQEYTVVSNIFHTLQKHMLNGGCSFFSTFALSLACFVFLLLYKRLLIFYRFFNEYCMTFGVWFPFYFSVFISVWVFVANSVCVCV